MEYLTPSQWLSFLRRSKPGEENAVPQGGQPILVVTPADQPLLPHHAKFLPAVVKVTRKDSQVVTYRRLRTPRVLVWGPQTSYASIYLFTVGISLIISHNCSFLKYNQIQLPITIPLLGLA